MHVSQILYSSNWQLAGLMTSGIWYWLP